MQSRRSERPWDAKRPRPLLSQDLTAGQPVAAGQVTGVGKGSGRGDISGLA